MLSYQWVVQVLNGTLVMVSVSAGLFLFSPVQAQAASFLNSCTNCHGLPPRDGARKANPHFNSNSSAFVGSHAKHLPSSPTNINCNVCHVPVAATNYGHQDGIINMAYSLKGYSSQALRAKYDKGVFFNQTSVPLMTNATCSNANCHFETKTQAWNATGTVNCTSCHGMPPSGTVSNPAGGLAGSHAKHNDYFGASCQKCHAAVSSFTHATSAGRKLKIQGYMRDPLDAVEVAGTYSGSGTNYLPSASSSQVFGSCNNLYCHSTGQSTTGAGAGTSVATPNWGSGNLNCGSCHQNMGPAANASATGKHAKHAQTAGITCDVCHGTGYTSTSVPATVGSTHVNKNINLAWTGLAAAPATNYSKGNSFTAGIGAYGNCSNTYCHSTVQNASNGNAGATYQTVSWTSTNTLTCAGCHVDMSTVGTGSHKIHFTSGAISDCSKCHLNYTNSTAAAATHVNGTIELGAAGMTYSGGSGATNTPGNGYGSCSATVCHGSGTVPWGGSLWSTTDQCGKCHSSNAAGAVTAATPYYNTSFPTKNSDPLDAKTGAHTAHISAAESLHPGLGCVECHGTVALNDATHMNGSTTFNWGTLARTGNLTPVYTSSTGKCSSVYCHGGAMPGGDTSGSNRTPTWNVPGYLPATLTAASCGTCHGFPPPASAGHPGGITIPPGFPTTSLGTTCSCHPNINQQVTGPSTYANVFVDKNSHINGKLDGGSCDQCHGYPPAKPGFKVAQNNWSSAKTEDYVAGGGAHTVAAHVSKTAKPSDGFAYCNKCHSSTDHKTTEAFLPSTNIKVTVNQRLRFENAKQFKYSSNRQNGSSHIAGTCTNSSCHFGASPKWDQ